AAAIGAEANAGRLVGVLAEAKQLAAFRQVPQSYGAVETEGREPASVRGVGHSQYRRCVAVQDQALGMTEAIDVAPLPAAQVSRALVQQSRGAGDVAGQVLRAGEQDAAAVHAGARHVLRTAGPLTGLAGRLTLLTSRLPGAAGLSAGAGGCLVF